MTITLTDQIPSGKNAMGVTRNGRHYPNQRFSAWREQASYEIIEQKTHWPRIIRRTLPLKGIVLVTITYRELLPVPANGVRDLPGMQDALWHLLTYSQILVNDGQIKGVTWQYPWRTEGPCISMDLWEG